MLKPGWLVTVIAAGVELSQDGPIWNVRFEVVVTAPVLRSSVPVVGPLLMKWVVAVTGMRPNCLKLSVASGMVSVAVRFPVLGSRLAASFPGPSGSVAFGALRNVFPVTLYLA